MSLVKYAKTMQKFQYVELPDKDKMAAFLTEANDIVLLKLRGIFGET